MSQSLGCKGDEGAPWLLDAYGPPIVGALQTFNYLPTNLSVLPRCGQAQVAVLTPINKAKACIKDLTRM